MRKTIPWLAQTRSADGQTMIIVTKTDEAISYNLRLVSLDIIVSDL